MAWNTPYHPARFSGTTSVAAAGQARPDLALVDLGLEGELSGQEAGERIGSLDVPVVYLTDEPDGDLLERSAASDPFGYVLRPLDTRHLRLAITTAVTRHARERERRATEAERQREIDRRQDLTASMKAVFDSMSEGVVVIGADLVPLFHNASAQRICAVEALDKGVRYWAERCAIFRSDMETRLPPEENPLLLALNGQATAEVDLFVRNELNPDGVHLRVSGNPLTGARGERNGAAIVFRDITGLKRAEAELERTRVRDRNRALLMETIFASISDGVVVADAQGRFTMFNASAERIVGVGKLDLKTGQWADAYGVFYPDRKTRVTDGTASPGARHPG